MKEQPETEERDEEYRKEYRHEPDYSEGGEIDKQLEKLKEMGLDIEEKPAPKGILQN